MNAPRRNVLQLIGIGTILSTRLGTRITGADDQDGDSIDWKEVGDAIGKQGKQNEGGVYKVTFPRTDLSVRTHGVTIKPALSFTSWAAFKEREDGQALVLGDLVLTEDEYYTVMCRLQDGGIGQTAIHKHLPEMSTPIWWTHIKGTGDPVEMARTINNALDVTATPMKERGSSTDSDLDLDTDKLDDIIGHTGKVKDGIYKYSIGLDLSISVEGVTLPSAMGAAMPLGFQPLGDGKAAINGDFALQADEVDPVIQALQEHDITVVSLHNHMLEEEPALYFMHFWTTDRASKLAQGLRAGLDKTESEQE